MCDELDEVPNGNITVNDPAFEGTVATIQCNPGYTLTGPSVISCLNTGEWDGTLPGCIRGILYIKSTQFYYDFTL